MTKAQLAKRTEDRRRFSNPIYPDGFLPELDPWPDEPRRMITLPDENEPLWKIVGAPEPKYRIITVNGREYQVRDGSVGIKWLMLETLDKLYSEVMRLRELRGRDAMEVFE